ncbi:D-2-hydroxyacid dehydrogenase [Caryophanon latum]|uniref:3-phosphoglycerate dehydrogenase n=1 Tax=Caryophanon latum TaxID=33977 RepID=A0A1C0YW11_9BACL|nr:D-2-hydroxyacid dehydrogenase [Caryophanon latum]OCS91335.1 3-phosphoglycerate dehydrogenase [Caryophanon latum]
MHVYASFFIRPDLREPLVSAFPNVQFTFAPHDVNEEALAKADVLLTYGEDVTEELLKKAPNIQWIFVASAGVEKLPARTILARDIVVSNVKGIHKKPMAESIIGHILALKRAIPWMYEQKKKGEWSQDVRQDELNGSTALILGPGAIGGEIGRLLQKFDVTTIGCNRSGERAKYMDETITFAQLKDYLPKADIVLSLLPKTPETDRLFSYDYFVCMKETAIFMNFGRSNIVEESVLVGALKEGQIAHVVLDVFDEEPLPKTSELWQLDGVVISPHISSRSSLYVERSLAIFKPSLRRFMQGYRNLENIVDLERGY